jgi:hypothetical protein
MAVRHFDLTLNGAAQQLSSAIPSVAGAAGPDEAYRQLIFSSAPANAAAIYIGATSSVSSASHGFSLDPTQASQQPVSVGPFESGPVKLSEIWVIGANAEILHVLGIPF